jgi:phosphoribosylformylglycinamidine synthase
MPTIVVDVMPKPELLDPQGKAVSGAFARLGVEGFSDVRIGKRFELTVEGEVTDEVLAAGEEMTVTSVAMNVLRLEDMFALRLQTLNEHYLDYAALLKMARALREQVDWDAVRARVRHTPYGRAFFTMLEGLGVVEEPQARAAAAHEDEVTVRPVDAATPSHAALSAREVGECTGC